MELATATAPVQTIPSVPQNLWAGETAVCLANGPSLTAADVAYCQGRARVFAVKDAIRLAPFADVLYACGADRSQWWQRNGPALKSFEGLRYTLDPAAATWATVLRNTGELGLETDPTGLRTGKNSGYQILNVAVHLGITRIVLLGYDMQPAGEWDKQHHWFGAKPYAAPDPPYALFLPCFETLLAPLAKLGVEVINATPGSALKCFPCRPLREALR